jgi:hypothetical protein
LGDARWLTAYDQHVRCKNRHYSLANLIVNRCPECGNAFDPNDPDTFETVASVWKLNTANVMVAVCLSAIIASVIAFLRGFGLSRILTTALTAIAFAWVFLRLVCLHNVHRMTRD